jgi:Na+-transporting NADH:ubiquinone oxidoreductase subunit C
MANNESTAKTIGVTLGVCFVCSILVSSATVSLKPLQEKNKEIDKKKNVLIVAQLYDKNINIDEVYKKISAKVIDLTAGKIEKSINPETFDLQKTLKDVKLTVKLDHASDLAGLRVIAKYSAIFFMHENNQIQKIILPIYGKGLWSTLYGFIALDKDCITVKGITFYEHGETPGLGGEVDNPRWKKIWENKKAFDEDSNLKLQVIKGVVNSGTKEAIFQIDGLSGATLTTRGVNNLVRFWLGDHGFGPFLKNLNLQLKSGRNQVENIL